MLGFGTRKRLAAGLALLLLAPAAAAAPHYVGLTLGEALDALRQRGLDIFFSSALVRPEMRVEAEPAGGSPREMLASLLAPHTLAVRDGPAGTLLVVPARLEAPPSPPPPPAPRGAIPERRELEALPVTVDEIEVVPPLEVGSIHGGTILHRDEIARVPAPRDPWAVVTRAPAVLSDRINVGGSESGTQALFLAPASTFDENVFAIDGVNTTDMAAVGASSIYYDFAQLEEMRISTGGGDVKTATAGVAVRMRTKRGTDEVRGSGRLLRTHADGLLGLFGQGSPNIADKLAPGQLDATRGNRVDQVLDYGLELGGPVRRERLWLWGSYGIQDIDLSTLGGFGDDTVLENAALKVNARLSGSGSLVASANRGDKRKDNRGAGPGRSPETTWRQFGPTLVSKLESSWVLSSRTLANGKLHRVDAGFSLIPRAGAGAGGGEALLDADGIWKNGFIGGATERDSQSFEAEATFYCDAGELGHALDAGGSSRRYRFDDDFRWSGPRQAVHQACNNVGTCGAGDLVSFERRGTLRVDLDYQALWVQDQVAAGRWSWTLGLRLDLQDGRNPPGRVDAHPVVPGELPAVDFAGADSVFDWATLSPRLSASYSLDSAGATLLRLSYGRFAEQLAVSDVARLNPLESAEVVYLFTDTNGDHVWQENEPLERLAAFGPDPDDPTGSAHRTDPGLRPELTDEVLAGVEQALSADWIVGLNFTYRRVSDVAETRPLVRDGDVIRPAEAADYALEGVVTAALPDGREGSASFYALDPSLADTGGVFLTNGERSREYFGATLSFNRRPSDRWMLRGYLTWGEATWNVPASFFSDHDPTDLVGGGDNDAALFAVQSRGSRSGVFLQSTWSAQLSGYYRVAPRRPWGFTVASSFLARQGFPIPYVTRFVSRIDGVNREGQLTDGVADFRADDVYVLDLSLEKELRWRERLQTTVSLSAFNLTNESYVLQRQRNLTSPRADHLEETLAPRIFRLGLRVTW